MPRTPLMKTHEVRVMLRDHPDNRPSVSFGKRWIKAKPEHCEAIGKCLMAWTEVEIYLAVLLAVIMQANTDTTIAVFQTIRRSSTRNEAVEKAASHALSKPDFLLVRALLMYVSSVEKTRNDLAHGFWGISHDIDDGLAWIPQEYMTLAHVQHSRFASLEAPPESPQYIKQAEVTRKEAFIYRLSDLQDILEAIETLSDTISGGFTYQFIKASAKENLQLDDAVRERLRNLAPIKEKLTIIRRREDR